MTLSPSGKPKAIITGIDRLIIDTGSWFEFLTELQVDMEKHKRIYGLLKEGKILWDDFKEELLGRQLKQKKVHKSRFDQSIGSIEISSDAITTVKELQEKGYIIGIISGSIDLIVKSIADRLSIEDWYANSNLIFDKNGYWTDITFKNDDAKVKAAQVQDFLTKRKLKPEEVIVLGHSEADIELFRRFPSVIVGSDNPELKELAWEEIKYFPRILQVLQRYE